MTWAEASARPATCLLSIDVEDWFHAERFSALVPRSTWEQQPLRVEVSVGRLLDLFCEAGVTATFFVLGWVAARCPRLVNRIAREGHEVACHGYHHERLPQLGPAAFAADVRRGKAVLEDLSGARVLGYRAPTFSLVPWALPILAEEGFRYDSSYNPAAYRYATTTLGGRTDGGLVGRLAGDMYEVWIPSLDIGRLSIPWGGSGYFRTYPYPLFRAGVRRILARRGAYVFYLHPWELDAGQPRLRALSRGDRFRQYHGISRTEAKLRRFLADFSVEPLRAAVERRAAALTGAAS